MHPAGELQASVAASPHSAPKTNYGICSSCLTPALDRLDEDPPAPDGPRRVRRRARIAAVPRP